MAFTATGVVADALAASDEHTPLQYLDEEVHVLLVQAEVVVFLEELACRLVSGWAGHDHQLDR